MTGSSRVFLVTCLCVVLELGCPYSLKSKPTTVLKDEENPDIYLSTPELIEKNGYPAETHYVATDDGYVLAVHRIPHGRHQKMSSKKAGRPVAFLQHGLLCSSSDWIMNVPEKALAYMLADNGYDVWIGNFRGNTYSRNHTTLDPNEDDFWKFSWDEMGYYDLPAMLDYVLGKTGREDLHYIGHSMGTTSFLVMTSLRPEYNKKIRLASLLAPVATVGYMKSPIRLLAPFVDEIERLLGLLGVTGEIFSQSQVIHKLISILRCDEEEAMIEAVCEDIVFLMCGFDSQQMNETALPVIVAHTPAGTSVQTLVHYAQEVNSGKFVRYDHGSTENSRVYGKAEPPQYPLGHVTAPVALYWSDNDWLADPNDVYSLKQELSNLVLDFRVALEAFNHLDFLWAKDADAYVYADVMKYMTRY